MRAFGLLLAIAARAATLTISPPVIYDCIDGAGVAQISWAGASGPVAVRQNAPDGLVVTGFSDPSGSVTAAGPWVTDGMQFFLVDQAGAVEATAVAHVSCGGTARTIDAGLQGGSYFPLQVGNTWIYRSNSRAGTGFYVTRSITETELIGDKTYFVLTERLPAGADTVIAKLRGDSSGMIWMSTSGGERAFLPAGQKTSYSGPLGSFSDALTVPNQGYYLGTSIYVRGIGLVHLDETELAGSSGGFFESLDLVEVRMPGVSFAIPSSTVSLSIETTDLDVTDKLVANCALPCYFVACGIAPGGPPDPPGTYRPCVGVRIEASASPGAEVRVDLLDAGGAVLFTDTRPADATGRALRYVRVPVYTTPQSSASTGLTVLAPGVYRVLGRVLDGGEELASSNISVHVR